MDALKILAWGLVASVVGVVFLYVPHRLVVELVVVSKQA